MKFRQLQENLRITIKKRIDSGDLTGLHLSKLTGFQQAHISNFINGKRYLSVEGMDKVLEKQFLSVLDLLDPHEINKRASIVAPSNDEFEDVVVADPEIVANEERIIADNVKDILKFKKAFLKRLSAKQASPRDAWQRFVMIKVDAQDGMSMYPRLLPGATVLLDRHYNDLAPYRKGEPNMYAVKKDGTCTVKYVEVQENTLILRPHNQSFPVHVIQMEEGKTSADYIVGRVCHVAIEV
jgi:hypothetical protein